MRHEKGRMGRPAHLLYPPEGYFIPRFENQNIFNGSFRWMLPMCAPGHLTTQEERDAVRTDFRKVKGRLRQTLIRSNP